MCTRISNFFGVFWPPGVPFHERWYRNKVNVEHTQEQYDLYILPHRSYVLCTFVPMSCNKTTSVKSPEKPCGLLKKNLRCMFCILVDKIIIHHFFSATMASTTSLPRSPATIAPRPSTNSLAEGAFPSYPALLTRSVSFATPFRVLWFTKMKVQSVCYTIPAGATQIYHNLQAQDHVTSFFFKSEPTDCLLSELLEMIYMFSSLPSLCFDIHPPMRDIRTKPTGSIEDVTLSFREYNDLAIALQISSMEKEATRYMEHFKSGRIRSSHVLGFEGALRDGGRAIFIELSESHSTSWARERAFVQEDSGFLQGIWRTDFQFKPFFQNNAAPPTYDLSSEMASTKQDFSIRWTRVESRAIHYDPEATRSEHARGIITVNLPGVLVKGGQLIDSLHNCYRNMQAWERRYRNSK